MLLLIVVGFHCNFTSYFVFVGAECKFLSVRHCPNVLLWSGCALISYLSPTTCSFPLAVRFDQLHKHKHLNCTEGELICETAGLPRPAAPSRRRSWHTDVSGKSTQQDHAATDTTSSEASGLRERTAAVSALPAEACALW